MHSTASIFIFFTIIGNVLLIIVTAKRTPLLKPHLQLIINLASADLLVGTIIMPTYYSSLFIPYGRIGCTIILILDHVICTVSYLTLAAIAWDRAFAISSPLKHRWKQTTGRIARVIIGIWTWSIAIIVMTQICLKYFATQAFRDSHRMIIVACITVYMPSLLILVANARVVINLWRRKRRKRKFSEVGGTAGHRFHEMLRVYQNDRGLSTMAAFTGVAFICWLPIALGYTLQGMDIHISNCFFVAGTWLLYMNSTLNPILYFIVNKESRKDVRSLFRNKCCDSSSRDVAAIAV